MKTLRGSGLTEGSTILVPKTMLRALRRGRGGSLYALVLRGRLQPIILTFVTSASF